jgi:putative oxidoreductase
MESARQQLGWAVVRVAFGLGLAVFHGGVKAFGEGKLVGFTKTVGDLGFPAPTFFAWSATLAELVGGLLLALGLATRPAAAMAGVTMLVALYRHLPDPFSKMELALLYLAVMVAAMLIGGGRYSIDAVLKPRLPAPLSRWL